MVQMFMRELKKCLLYEVSTLECPLWRGFIIRDSLGIHPGQNFLSALQRCPFWRMSALERFHCNCFPELTIIRQMFNIQIFKVFCFAFTKQVNTKTSLLLIIFPIFKISFTDIYIFQSRSVHNSLCQDFSHEGIIVETHNFFLCSSKINENFN